jgi:hypothetical protein
VACNCEEAKKYADQIKAKRKAWDAKALDLISRAVSVVNSQNPRLAKDLMALSGELNSITISESDLDKILK